MSANTIETFLYDLAYKPGAMQRFHADPDALFADYYMSADDSALIRNWQVKAMHEQGVSPMLLLLSYTAVYGIERRNEYLTKMGMVPAMMPAPA